MSVFDSSKFGFAFSNPASTETTAPVRSIVIIGENQDIDTGTYPETLWEVGGLYVFPTAASTASVVSSSVNDTSAGTGARYVLIEGLNSSYAEINETIIMNGTTPVVSTSSFYRVNSVRVVYSGSGKTNAGNITVTVDSKTVSQIATGESLAHTGVYTVPADHTLFLNSLTCGITRTASSGFALITSKVYVPSTNTIYESSNTTLSDGPFTQKYEQYSMPRIPEKCDIWYDCSYVSANNTSIALSVRSLLVHQNWIPKLTR
jgi:hypothetical protein